MLIHLILRFSDSSVDFLLLEHGEKGNAWLTEYSPLRKGLLPRVLRHILPWPLVGVTVPLLQGNDAAGQRVPTLRDKVLVGVVYGMSAAAIYALRNADGLAQIYATLSAMR